MLTVILSIFKTNKVNLTGIHSHTKLNVTFINNLSQVSQSSQYFAWTNCFIQNSGRIVDMALGESSELSEATCLLKDQYVCTH